MAKRYTLQINVWVRDSQQSGGLQVTEEVFIDADGFLEVAKILGMFHDLAQKLKG